MWIKSPYLLAVCAVFLVRNGQAKSTYKLCVVRKSSYFRNVYDNCASLEQAKAPVKCEYGVDRLDCLRKVSSGLADFGVFEAEELLVAKNHPGVNDILITTMFQRTSSFRPYQYQMVALIKSDLDVVTLNDLRNKRFCHPGFDPEGNEDDWNDIFSLYFEDRTVLQQCEANRTVAENRVKSLADFFEVSCKAGTWAVDPKLDSALKRKYGSICQQCDMPEKCNFKDKYWGRRGVLYCLSDCMGDVAWARLDDVLSHFKTSSSYSPYLYSNLKVCNSVNFLCPNGTTQHLSTRDPCVWVARPNTAIAAHSPVAKDIQQLLNTVFIEYNEGKAYRGPLNRLLESSPRHHTVELQSPGEYLERVPGFLSSESTTRCGKDRAIKVCTSSQQEISQCQWLSTAAASYGVEPDIVCESPAPGHNCFEAVKNLEADVFLTDSDQLMPAVRDYGLTPLLYETVHDYMRFKYYGTFVDTHANITGLVDLKGKRACFTAIDGVGWTSLALALKNTALLPEKCPYSEAVNDFFSSICITGPIPEPNNLTNVRSCTLPYTSESESTHAGTEIDTVDCLISGGGEVAILSVDSVKKYYQSGQTFTNYARDQIGTRYKWLCDDNKLQDKPCFLTWTTMGQVLVNPTISSVRKEDIISTFKSLDLLFGDRNKRVGSSPFAFDMYGGFDIGKDPIFQMSGDSLELAESYLRKTHALAVNYESQLKDLYHCKEPASSASTVETSSLCSLLAILVAQLVII